MSDVLKKSTYQICVSGAAKGKSVEQGAELAVSVGKEIARAKQQLLTGATVGLPNYAAIGAKSEEGVSVGISPAASKIEHIKKYRLPINCYDVILFTGLHYVGRDTLLVASSDAVVSVGGRLGTLHEFTISMEMDKPIGFLMGAGGISTEIKDILRAAGIHKHSAVIFDDNPKSLVKRIIAILDAKHANDIELYRKAVACSIRESLV